MLSPDEYEAAFYADTTNANLTPSSKLETANRASNEPGDPHCVRGRFSDRRQPASAAADQPGPVGVPGRVERVPRFAADRGRGTRPSPHLAQLTAARRSTLTAVVALRTRGVADVPDRVEAIRSAAAA
jgi:hypothetical protein